MLSLWLARVRVCVIIMVSMCACVLLLWLACVRVCVINVASMRACVLSLWLIRMRVRVCYHVLFSYFEQTG